LGTMPGHPLTWELEDLSPIELTTEILIKSGFELKYGWLWKLYYDDIMNPITLRHITNNKFLKDEPLEKLFFRWDQHIDVYYVHQLQNLYFALTGTELDIKL